MDRLKVPSVEGFRFSENLQHGEKGSHSLVDHIGDGSCLDQEARVHALKLLVVEIANDARTRQEERNDGDEDEFDEMVLEFLSQWKPKSQVSVPVGPPVSSQAVLNGRA